jgi:hypothetical protein
VANIRQVSLFVTQVSSACQQIGPPKGRIASYLKELDEKPIEPVIDQNLSQEENIDRLEIMAARIPFEIDRLKSAVAIIDKSHDAWVAHIAGLASISAEKLTAEQAIYDAKAAGAGNFIELVDSARAVVVVLEAKKREADSLLRSLRSRERERQSSNSSESAHNSFQPAPIRIHLPKLEIIKFDGEMLKWSTFWQSFEASIDSTDIEPVHKFAYLMTYLKGEALRAIEGYAVSSENYPIVVALLKERFGSKHLIRHSLHAELRTLPRSGESIGDLRRTFEAIERICRLMQEQG